MIYSYAYTTPLGPLGIAAVNDTVYQICRPEILPGSRQETKIILAAYRQITEYLKGWRKSFDLNFNLSGPPFFIDVWRALQKIPYGETVNYLEFAALLGQPDAYHAVGAAANRNPLPIIVPCHRLVGGRNAKSKYVLGLPTKAKLLELEKNFKAKFETGLNEA